MSPNPPRKELRLFVSSTFRDLMPEREQLVKKVFPRIRKECRARGVEFTEIDLRWGITEEESRSGRTIRICLEEIDRCRPYFIGIIGSRYGWVPGITEIEKDAEMLQEFPWLHDFAAQEKSIIEMEFAHGAIHEKNDSAFFYEQTSPLTPLLGKERGIVPLSLPRRGVRGEVDPLDELKHSLQSTGLPYRRFTDPEELGEQVFQDIVTILDRDFPGKRELTPLEHERIEHEAYSLNRRQSYVANPAYYEAFEKFVNADGPPLILWGKSGLGKSALMAYLAHEYQTQHPDAFVVQHFIGAAEGSDPEDVMRQVMMEIKDRYGLSDLIPSDDQALREEFPVWLAKVGSNPLLLKEGATDRLVLFIDALNQLTGIAPEMHWLPEFIPANVRLVLSTTTGLPLEQLRERKWNELELSPLNEEQREAIALGFLQRYRKTLPAEQLHRLSADKKSESPLFLRTVLEELRIFGHFSTLGEALENYLASADERELFQKVLARMEHDHGADAVRDVLTAIWASRHGLSESELMEITGMSRMALSELMIAMEYHLMQREGYYSFFHNYLREAVERRYLPEEAAQKSAHALLGEYFSTREFGHRRMNEESWQWEAAQNKERLKASLLEPEMLAQLDNDHWRYEAFAHWRAFDRVEIDASYIPRLMNSGLPAAIIVEVFKNVIDLLSLADAHSQAQEFYTAGFPEIEKLEIDTEQRLWLRERQVLILNRLGKANEVIPLIEGMLRQESIAANPKLRIELLDNLAFARSLNGQYDEAEKVLRTSIEECKIEYGENAPELTTRINSLATNLNMLGRYDETEELLIELLARASERFGAGHPEVAFAMWQLANCRMFAGKFDGVGEQLEQADAIFVRSLGLRHYYTCHCRYRMAELKLLLNDPAPAKSILLGLMDIMTSKYPGHKDTTSWGCALGYAYYLTGDYGTAAAYYEQYLPRLGELLGEDSPYVIQRRERLNVIREKMATLPAAQAPN